MVVDNITSLLPALLNVSQVQFTSLQEAARNVCQTHYRSTALMIARTIEHFLERA